jgi:hypothetical protein
MTTQDTTSEERRFKKRSSYESVRDVKNNRCANFNTEMQEQIFKKRHVL